MKLQRLAVAYDRYLMQFYGSQPGLSERSYDEQMDALNHDCFPGASDGLMVEMETLGYETRSHVINASSAQRAWVLEHGARTENSQWEIAIQQVLHYAPDVLFINPYVTPRSWITELRDRCPSLRIVIGRYSSPVDDVSVFANCDLILSGDRDQVASLRTAGLAGVHLHHGFDVRILQRTQPSPVSNKLFFAGQILLAPGFHLHRGHVIDSLLAAGVPMDLRLLSEEMTLKGRSKSRLRGWAWQAANLTGLTKAASARIPRLAQMLGTQRPAAVLPVRMRKSASPPLFGLDLYQRMREVSVQLNVHGDVSARNANNLRLWEATGVGSCLLTDRKANLGELFETDSEIVVFDSVEECVEKAAWLLDNPTGARRIGSAGHARTLSKHTMGHRAREMSHLLEERL